MAWTHPSLDRPAEYSISNGRVLKGRVIIAYAIQSRDKTLTVRAPDGRFIGSAESPAQAMLMATRDEEARR